MDIIRRRDFLKGAGAILLGHTFLNKVVQAQEKETAWFKTTHMFAESDNLSPVGKKHAPVIGVPGYIKANQIFFLSAEVGRTPHVMTPNHRIKWIEVYMGDSLISRTEFSPLSPRPTVTVPLSVTEPTVLRVVQQCNLHGIWESEVNITPVRG